MIRISTCAHPLAHVANRKRSTGVDGSSFASLPPLDVGRPTLAFLPPPCSVSGRPDFLELPSILRIAASAPGGNARWRLLQQHGNLTISSSIASVCFRESLSQRTKQWTLKPRHRTRQECVRGSICSSTVLPDAPDRDGSSTSWLLSSSGRMRTQSGPSRTSRPTITNCGRTRGRNIRPLAGP